MTVTNLTKYLLVLLIMLLTGCGSNESYIADVEDELKEILVIGKSKKDVVEYFKDNGYEYSELLKKDCRPWGYGDFKYNCEYESDLHTRISVGFFLNPVESGAHVHLFFNKQDELVFSKILIIHSFL